MGSQEADYSLLQHTMRAVHPRIESRQHSFDFALLLQDELNLFSQDELNLFSQDAIQALDEESEISDDGNGQLSLNPGLYVSPQLAKKIAARTRNSCPPRCILRSKNSTPKEKRRISWCNPVVQDMQAPPGDLVIRDDDDQHHHDGAIATNAHYLHRAGILSKAFPYPMCPYTTTFLTREKSSPRKQRIVLATLLGVTIIVTLAAAALESLGTQDARLLNDVLSFTSEQLCPTRCVFVSFVLRRMLQATVFLGFLVLQLVLIAWFANDGGSSSVEREEEEKTMHGVSDLDMHKSHMCQ